MGELGLTKIFGAILAVALGLLGLKEVSNITFGKTHGHHGHHEDGKSLNDRIKEAFPHYHISVSEGGGSGPAVEEVFDLGLALLNASIEDGAKSFRAKCQTCHTPDDGGANGTGPNLWSIVSRAVAGKDGFGYSSTMSAYGGEWSYENLNNYLENPKAYMPGTAMAFAGLRRDGERANVMAYLGSLSANPVAFPEPIPAATPDVAEIVEGDVVQELPIAADGDAEAIAADAAEAVSEEAAGIAAVSEATTDVVTEAVTDVVEAASETTGGLLEAAGDVVETVTETATDTAEGLVSAATEEATAEAEEE